MNYLQNKCPVCGSKDLEKHTVEEVGKILDMGLPHSYIKAGWLYYVCQECFEKVKNNNWKGEFVCTFVDGQAYLWLSGNEKWVPIGKPSKLKVQFT